MGAYTSVQEVGKKTKSTSIRALLFNAAVLSALTYVSGSWNLGKHDDNAVSVIECSIEKVMLGVIRLKRQGIRNSCQQSKTRDAASSDWITIGDCRAHNKKMPTPWSYFFTKPINEKCNDVYVS